MKRIMALALLLQTAAFADYISQVVCFQCNDLKQGWNEIKVGSEAFGEKGLFTTLDRIGRFSPPEAVIGDELVFDLDGFHQKYRFTSYNATNSTYSLTLAMDARILPPEISLDWIPLPRVFWINHVSPKPVSFDSSGELSFSNKRKLESAEQRSAAAAQAPAIPDTTAGEGGVVVIVRSVSTNETNLTYTFKGGRIKAESDVDARFDVERKTNNAAK